MNKVIEPIDFIREEFLYNKKINGCHIYLNCEMVYLNTGDISLCLVTNALYGKSNRLMRIKRKYNRQRYNKIIEDLNLEHTGFNFNF